MDYKRIQIDSIGIGLSNIYNLDLIKDEYIKTYLAVGELFNESHDITLDTNNLNHIHNLIVTDKSVGVNTTRNNIIKFPNDSLLIGGNLRCQGSIYAESVILSDDVNITANLTQNILTFNQVLNRISSHLSFYNVKDYLQNNIYTTQNVTIGNLNYATNNTNPLKISRHCNNNVNNIQLVIQNNDNTNNEQATKFSCGIIGNVNNSPFHIITSENMPIHFNISKSYENINNLYKDQNIPIYSTLNYPSLAIDITGTVLLNIDKISSPITYNKYINTSFSYEKQIITEYPKIYVNGSLYCPTIITFDYGTNTIKNIDDIYIRQGSVGGLSFYPNQIYGGSFNKNEFTFTSNVYIGNRNNNYKLTIYGDAEITNKLISTHLLTTNISINNNLFVSGGGICDFNSDCFFSAASYFDSLNCGNNITTKSLYITDKLYYNGTEISLDNIINNSTSSTTTSITTSTTSMTLTNSINIGGQITNITDTNYNSEIVNLYKYRDNQKTKFQLYLHDSTVTPYGSSAYIGHIPLNTLNAKIDNSLVFLTQYNSTWNNIYFYAGKNKSTINNTRPNLAIIENNRIGINTLTPEKTLDVYGDIITSNYYIRTIQNEIYECEMIKVYNNTNNINQLNINILANNILDNNHKLNVKGGINSIDGYYENNNKLCSIIYTNNNNAIIENTNLGIGVQIINPSITMPLQIQNTNINNNKINNSVISFYRSRDNSKYSGIEFCDDSTNINVVNNNKWYIYKNHVSDDLNFAGPLQFGYMHNTYKPLSSCINLYYDNNKYYIDINNTRTYNSADEYNKNKENVRINGNIRITGDIDIDGSINIKGNYKFNDNNILFSPNPVETIINKIYSLGNNIYYFDTILSANHPKNISFKNNNIASDVYSNIIDDINNLNYSINLTNAESNWNIAKYNVINNSTTSNIITNYYSNIKINSNNIINNINNINNFSSILNENLISNINNKNTNDTLSDTILKSLINSNVLYAYSNYIYAANNYTNISNTTLLTYNTYNISSNFDLLLNNYKQLSLNYNDKINTSYISINYNPDINIILKTTSSNNILSSTLVDINLNYKSIITNLYTTLFSIHTISQNIMNTTMNNYYNTSNYYKTIEPLSAITPTIYSDILNSNYSHSLINSNNLNTINSISLVNNYNNISDIIFPLISQIQLMTNNIQLNLNTATKIYNSISSTNKIYIIDAASNYTIANNNYNNNSNISNIIYTYSNIITNTINNDNINIYYNIIPNLRDIININNNFNIDYYNNNNNNQILNETEIYINTSNNSNLAYSNYQISSNIHNKLSNINEFMTNYNIIAYNNYISTSNYSKFVNNNYNNLINIYNNINYVIDISNILKTGFSNNLIASNIYDISLNYYNNINYINLISSNYSNLSLQNNNDCLNTYNKCLSTFNKNIQTKISENMTNGTLILTNIESIYYKIINNYSTIYTSLSSSTFEYLPEIANNNILTIANKTATSKIISSIDKNISVYSEHAYNNSNIANNLDIDISKLNIDYNKPLIYYSNYGEIGIGINTIINFINNDLLNIYRNYKINITTTLIEYNYIFDIDVELKPIYNNIIDINNICINLLSEIFTDTSNLIVINNISTNYDYQILLESVMHITNKYINFINTSYNLANATSVFASAINNYINIYIATSLSLIPLLNTIIEYANSYLNTAWNTVSQNIVLFASLSYSINSHIGSMPLKLLDNETGNNTDVLIIGNNIKIYPTKSLLIGHENTFTQWLETLTDIDITNLAPVYIYNYNVNKPVCNFNCKSQNFISSSGGILSLKSSTSIDINLIDTTYNNYNESMFDGISLKYSHIFHRDNVNSIVATTNNSLFELIKKTNATNPYFSCYTTDNNNNIFNIGSGNFYDITTYKCLIENTVVHINQNTSTYLLKLTNLSTNPVLLSFFQNNTNHWEFKIDTNFSYIYNTNTILNITPNGLAINASTNNATLLINSFYNKPALELRNNYNSVNNNNNIITRNINITNDLIIGYNENGIQYSKISQLNDNYDISTSIFNINYNIDFEIISYTLHNVSVNYTNINETTPFIFDGATNTINLLPIIENNDPNIFISIPANQKVIKTAGPYTVGLIENIYIDYIIPINTINYITEQISNTGVNAGFNLVLQTRIERVEAHQDSDYANFILDYIIQEVNIRNIITYNKYAPFILPELKVELSNYNYQLERPNNIVAKSLMKSQLIPNKITYTQQDNLITINNKLDYLKDIINKTKINKTFTETIHKLYSIQLFGYKYNIPILITINDTYDIYGDTYIDIEYYDKSVKLPLITQRNIYNNTHNIYSYTDDYELYFNNDKLININSKGTLTTTGNIETNNIYLKGDIYNRDGMSLYDNILTLINNISSTTNFELNTKNIILNPTIESRNDYKGGILINGNNLNIYKNNLFQINNFLDNDNFITLNSCTANSYIHFNNKIDNYNSIYRIGTKNETFGIWKLPPTINYDANFYIETTNNIDLMNVITMNYRPDYKNFDINVNGIISQISDSRLKTNILKIENALTKLSSLDGITYNVNGSLKRETGLNAEDVYNILPEAISINNAGYSNIAYGNITGLIIEAIKELKIEINQIKASIL
jgi:hypothetical protein